MRGCFVKSRNLITLFLRQIFINNRLKQTFSANNTQNRPLCYRRPEVISDLEHTEIRVWNIDLADSYPDLTTDEKSILRFITKGNRTPSIKHIKDAIGITDYATRKAVQSLEEAHLIRKIGSGPSTAYTLQVDSIEFLTQLQVVMEQLKKQMQ